MKVFKSYETHLEQYSKRLQFQVAEMICDEENCKLNLQDPNGDTALHFAGRAAQKELFECILSKGIVHTSPAALVDAA